MIAAREKASVSTQKIKPSLGKQYVKISDLSSQRENQFPTELAELQQLLKYQEKLKKNVFFWNSLVDGKLESISSCCNLFILLLMITLGGDKYNGTNNGGNQALGWICVGQVCVCYLLLIIIKFYYIPNLEKHLTQNNTQGFKLYRSVQREKVKINDLQLTQLEIILETLSLKRLQFEHCFKHADAQLIIHEINNTIQSRSNTQYKYNNELKKLKLREQRAKWWQNFWQNFVLSKTYSIPGILLLVFIITPLSNATTKNTSVSMHTAQGWLAVGFWATNILIFIIIKLFLWDYLNQNVENTKSDVFIAYNQISLKHKQLKSFSLQQLQDLQNVLVQRVKDFQLCFRENPNAVLESVREIIKERLPNKKSEDEEVEIREIIKKQQLLSSNYKSWLLFFNLRLIPTIINSQKFFIVVALTFVLDFNVNNKNLTQNAQIVLGSVGIVSFIIGYLFYLFLRFCYLGILERKVKEGRSSPFTTFRLVYFGNKTLSELQVHELQDILCCLNLRRSQFVKCFPNIDSQLLHSDIQKKLSENNSNTSNSSSVLNLLNNQIQSKKWLAFWSGYVDTHLMTSIYSIYVILVLMVQTFGKVYSGVSYVMGWIGVGIFGLLILIVLFFKTFLIEYLTNNSKSLRIDGYSEFNLVYTKVKKMKDVELSELQKIHTIIESYPIEFKRCFPKVSLKQTSNEVKLALVHKQQEKSHSRVRTTGQQIKYQIIQLQLSRNKAALSVWTSLVFDRFFVITPVAIVIYILWGQTIATTTYGITVCGFLTVANLAIIIFLILFFNLFYRGYLQRQIEEGEKQIKMLSTKQLFSSTFE